MRTELVALAKEYFRDEDFYIISSREALLLEKKPIKIALDKLANELSIAKKILEKNAKKEKRDYAVLELESALARTRESKDTLAREFGKVEGLISAEERIIRKQKELVLSDEHKMIRLKDVEELAREINAEIEDAGTFQRIKRKIAEFLKSKREAQDSNALVEAETSLKNYQKDKDTTEKRFKEANQEEKELREKYEVLKKEIETEKDSGHNAEKEVFHIMSEENELISKLNLLKMREDKLNLEEEEFKRELEELKHLAGPEVSNYKSSTPTDKAQTISPEDRKTQEVKKHQIEKFKIRLEDSNVSGMEEVAKEYKDTSERDTFLERELLDLEKSAETLAELIKELETRLAVEFSTGLEKINKEFNKLFNVMFGGGEANLALTKEQNKKPDLEEGELEEEEEKIEEGLDIKVSLPKKKIKGLIMLSGGERALTSIALIFAVSQVNPPPFIILDETDAALDESNSKKYGDLVEILSKHSQLILITHNRETMSRAGVIYGVTMGSSGISKLLSISFDEAVEVAK